MHDKTKLANLQEESEAIQFANDLYLGHKVPSSEATAEYRRRSERLQHVRREMKELQENV
jgi:hypothetical protein